MAGASSVHAQELMKLSPEVVSWIVWKEEEWRVKTKRRRRRGTMDLLLVIIIVIITRGNNMRLQLQRLLSESGINQLIRHGQGVMNCHKWMVCGGEERDAGNQRGHKSIP